MKLIENNNNAGRKPDPQSPMGLLPMGNFGNQQPPMSNGLPAQQYGRNHWNNGQNAHVNNPFVAYGGMNNPMAKLFEVQQQHGVLHQQIGKNNANSSDQINPYGNQ